MKTRNYKLDGLLNVAEFGCGNTALLIVSGELRGHLWSIWDVFGPCSDNDFGRLFGFFEWFEQVYKEAPW